MRDMKNYIAITALVLCGASASYASLIPLGAVPSSGSGLGAVTTVLTFTSPGSSSSETGCVGAGSGGAVITGSTACPSATFAGGNEQAINNVFSTATAGFTNFNNFQFVFNASEPGSATDITLNNLALTIYNSAGVLQQTDTLASAYVIADAFPGVGNAGFGFMLDATEAAQANALLTANPGAVFYVGAAANATNATGGLETIFARTTAATAAIPEPSTIFILGSGLLLLSLSSLGRLRRNR
jgi:hypothetical protein